MCILITNIKEILLNMSDSDESANWLDQDHAPAKPLSDDTSIGGQKWLFMKHEAMKIDFYNQDWYAKLNAKDQSTL